MNDLVADAAGERFNVSWTRISPMVMSVHDNINRTFISGESDFHFGREAYGDADAVKAFYFACSSTFSPIERYVGETLFPGSGDLGAVTTGLGYILNHNGTLEIFIEDGCVLIRELNNNSNVLIYDNSTGLLHDRYCNINGAYCYSNQQTEWAFDLGEELLLFADSIWSFLMGNMEDLSFLNSSTLKLVTSCNAFLSMGTIFTEAITAESLTGISTIFAELGIESLSTLGAYVLLPAVLFLNIDPVGEEDGYVDNYWKTINNTGSIQNTPSYNEVVQIKMNKNFYYESDYEKYMDIAEELNFFSMGLAIPPGDDGGNVSLSKTVIIIIGVPFVWASFYIGNYVLKGLTTDQKISNIRLKFNNRTNETEVQIIYK